MRDSLDRVRGAIRAWRTPTRPLASVPRSVRVALIVALVAQLAWHAVEPAPSARRESMPPAPPASVMRLAALGEPSTLAASGLLWLQFHDEQPGLDISWNDLDYATLRAWLERWQALAPDSDYPLMLAVRIYGQVADPARQRVMLDFVRSAFEQRPLQRWRWLAEAALIARHRVEDLELALDYARLLTERTRAGQIPHWARDLQILILEDMGELEAARVLIGGLLASGEIDDRNEIRFLERKLAALERRQDKKEAKQ